MAHVVVLVAEFEGDKGIEAAGPVLELAKAFHMVYAMGIGFDMAVEHSCIGMHSFEVGGLMDLQPAIGVNLVGADDIADIGMEDLGSASGHGIQSRCV